MIRTVIACSLLVASTVAVEAAPLQLPEAQAEARKRAPERAVADAELDATKVRAAVAGRAFTNDPVLTGRYTQEVLAGDNDERGWSVGIEWPIELSGSWRPRRAAARSQVRAAVDDRTAALADLDVAVALAFADVAGAQRRFARAERLVALHEVAVTVAERQRSAGGGNQLDVDAAALDFRAAKAARADARGSLGSARLRLARLLGRASGADLVVGDDLELGAITAAQYDAVVARDPRVRAAASELEAARATVDAERRAVIPPVTVGVEIARSTMDIPRGAFATAGDLTATWREWEIGIHLSVPLPIIDRRLEPRAEARGRVLLATANVDRTKADVRTEVGEIGERLAAALEAVQAMKDVPEIIDREIGLLDKALRAGAIEMPAWSQQARRLEEVGQLFDEAVLALRRARAAWIRFEGAR